jgi:hypothetical protein
MTLILNKTLIKFNEEYLVKLLQHSFQLSEKNNKTGKYSQTCSQRSPLGQREDDCIRKVTSYL